ncbi:MAG: hypothetical protein EOM50_19715 [Erysipelotrichia bacterium]|nr:hypothetical protein [Erysipelotrichia bacterium]
MKVQKLSATSGEVFYVYDNLLYRAKDESDYEEHMALIDKWNAVKNEKYYFTHDGTTYGTPYAKEELLLKTLQRIDMDIQDRLAIVLDFKKTQEALMGDLNERMKKYLIIHLEEMRK